MRDDALRVLAVSSPERMRLLPDVPTFAEPGYGDLEMSDWNRMRPALATRIAAATRQALDGAELRERLTAAGGVHVGNPPGVGAAEITRIPME